MKDKTADLIILIMIVTFFVGAVLGARVYASKAGAAVPVGSQMKYIPINDIK